MFITNKIDKNKNDEKSIKKSIKLKIRKLLKSQKLSKSKKLKSEKFVKSKKFLKSKNSPKFIIKKARLSFLIFYAKMIFNHL